MNKPFEMPKQAERFFKIERSSVNPDARTVELAFSSEARIERWWGIEILDHSQGAVDLTRLKAGGPLLCDHDTTDIVGVIESVRIDADRVGRAVVRFGKSVRAEEVFQDVLDEIRTNVSVAYSIEQAQAEGDAEVNNGEVDVTETTYRITHWTPFEISLVSVPADISVGVGREAAPTPIRIPLKENKMATPDPVVEVKEPPAAPIDVAKVQKEARDAETSRASTIIAIGEKFAKNGVDKLAAEAVRSGMSVEDFRAKAMDMLSTAPLPTPALGLNGQETQRYSILRAIRAMVDRDWKSAGFERECHLAICKRAGLDEAPNNGFYVPYEVQKRDLSSGTPSAGGYLVATDNLGGSFIDLLRNRALVAKFGATMLTGLVGNVTIPKQSGANTAYWLTNETTSITEGNLTLGQLALSPKNVGAYQEVSRQLMLQSSPAADNLVMNDLAKVLALGIDLAALNGSGASGQPTGLINTAGIGGVTGTSLAYAGIVEFQTDVAGGNALVENCGYMTTPTVAGLLKQRQRFTSTDSPLWEGNIVDGKIEGFRASSTLQMPAGDMIFGDWSQIVIGEWGMLEIALNPYANFTAAITGIRAIQTVDVGVRIPGAFSLATSIT